MAMKEWLNKYKEMVKRNRKPDCDDDDVGSLGTGEITMTPNHLTDDEWRNRQLYSFGCTEWGCRQGPASKQGFLEENLRSFRS